MLACRPMSVNEALACQPLLLQPEPPDIQVKAYSTGPEGSVAVTAVMTMADVLMAAGGDCQLIGFGDGGVVSPADCVVALDVCDAVVMFPAASLARTL